ncbi:MAG: ABC transporter substrate-binding protein [Natronomonas sp.]
MTRHDPAVASLLPSATEIVSTLGVEPVATSHECDHPPSVADTPTVVESSIDADAGSGEIDDQVQAAESEGGVYRIDRETLTAVDPDLVISQGICDVCAVDTVLVESAIEECGLTAELVTTDPHSLGDVLDDIERIGAALDRGDRAAAIRRDLEATVESIADRGPDEPTPDVVVLDWLDPVMVAGHWVPELVEIAGGEFVLGEPTAASRPIEWEQVRACDPDVLVAAPCGFEPEQTLKNVGDLTTRPGFEELTAVKTDRAYVIDGHHLMNRPGPRLVDSLAALASVIHPDHFETPETVRRLRSGTTREAEVNPKQ